MNSREEQGLADEIRAEMSRQRYTARQMQRATGTSSSAWSTYFVQKVRRIPMHLVFEVADILDVPASELIRRAEERIRNSSDDDSSDELTKSERRAIAPLRTHAPTDPDS